MQQSKLLHQWRGKLFADSPIVKSGVNLHTVSKLKPSLGYGGRGEQSEPADQPGTHNKPGHHDQGRVRDTAGAHKNVLTFSTYSVDCESSEKNGGVKVAGLLFLRSS